MYKKKYLKNYSFQAYILIQIITITQTFRNRIPPTALDLAHRRRIPNQQHSRMTSINDACPKSSSCLYILQPPIIQRSRMPTVNLLARWQWSTPFTIRSTSAWRLSNQRVSIFAFIADNWVVRKTGIYCFSVLRILRRWTLHCRYHWNDNENRYSDSNLLCPTCDMSSNLK